MGRRKHRESTRLFLPLRCRECGHYLARTPSGFLACPLGHGRLVRETDDDPQPQDETSGLWVQDELPPAA
jgi:hypothetical protein